MGIFDDHKYKENYMFSSGVYDMVGCTTEPMYNRGTNLLLVKSMALVLYFTLILLLEA